MDTTKLIKIMKRVHDNKQLKDTNQDINTYSEPNEEKVKTVETEETHETPETPETEETPIDTFTMDKDEHLIQIITQALINTINKNTINPADPEGSEGSEGSESWKNSLTSAVTSMKNIFKFKQPISDEYKWKECDKRKDHTEPKDITAIKKKCLEKINEEYKNNENNENKASNWKIVTILNNEKCIIYNIKTKDNQIMDIETGQIHQNSLINTIVKSVLAKK